MVTIEIKIKENKGKGSCDVRLVKPKESKTVTESEQRCSIIVWQELEKAMEGLKNK